MAQTSLFLMKPYLYQLRVDSKINSHSVCKMCSDFGTFENRLWEVIFELTLSLLFFSILLFDSLSLSARQSNVAVYAYNAEPILSWDPSVEYSNGVIVLNNIYETLLRYQPSTDQFTPILATRYSVSKDKLTWTFDIRKNVYFHDGALLDAEAVKFSIERTIQVGKDIAYIWNPVDDITVLSKFTVQFKLKYPAPLDLIVSCAYGAFILSPKAVISHFPDWLSEGNEAGTGPYILRRFKMGDFVVLSAFRNYWRGWKKNQFDQITIKRFSKSTTRKKLIETGDADITMSLSVSDFEALKNNQQVSVLLADSFMNLILFLNTEKPPLNNKNFRKAMSLVFPHEKVMQKIMKGYATPSHGPIPRGIWGHNSTINPLPYNINQAKQLILKSGIPKNNMRLVLTHLSGSENEQKISELFKDELKKIDIDLKIQGMSWESQWELAKNIKPENRQDFFIMKWWPDLVSPQSWLYNLYHSQKDINYNVSYLKSKVFDQLIDRADRLSLTNREKATRLIFQAQKYLLDEAVSIFIYDQKSVWAFQKSFKGFQNNPAYQNVVFFYDTYRETPLKDR